MRTRQIEPGRESIDCPVARDYPAFTASEHGAVEGLPPAVLYPPRVVFFRQGG